MSETQGRPKGYLFAWMMTGVILVVIAVLTLSPPIFVQAPVGNDKLGHMVAFAVLTFPLGFVRPDRWLVIWFGALGYGLAIELVQPMFGRMAELGDLVADGIGAAAGLALGILGACGRRWLRSA